MNYSLLKSKTFWTIVLMFVTNGLAAISATIPPFFLILINALLSSLASYFHLDTAKSVGAVNNTTNTQA